MNELEQLKCENERLRKEMQMLTDRLEASRAKCELIAGDLQETEKKLLQAQAENDTFRYCISRIFGDARG